MSFLKVGCNADSETIRENLTSFMLPKDASAHQREWGDREKASPMECGHAINSFPPLLYPLGIEHTGT